MLIKYTVNHFEIVNIITNIPFYVVESYSYQFDGTGNLAKKKLYKRLLDKGDLEC